MVQYFLRNDCRLSFFVKYCIQRPFAESVTALIKMWRFLEGVFVAIGGKKGKAEAGTCIRIKM